MKKYLLKYTICSLFIATIFACSDDYFDVNTPSGTITEEQLSMSDLLAPVIHSTMGGQRSAELAFGNYVQNFVGEGGVAAGETQASGLWRQVYLYVLPNTKVIKKKAIANKAIHYQAIADVLVAVNLGIATDTWDNIPYSEASQREKNLTPNFDTQESIYNEIFKLLDGAISALQKEDQSGFSIKNDLIYKGDINKWLRAAYTLKARYQLHLVNKGIVSPNDVLTTVSKGFMSNDDNFMMYYNEKNINPWYSSEILSRETGNTHNDIASQLVSSMNGDYYPFINVDLQIDPRLPVFAAKNGTATQWKGYVSGGGGKSTDGTDANTEFAKNGFYTKANSPLVLITYAEAMFIKAEAAFLANGGTVDSVGANADAYDAYLEGIRASMQMYEVDGANYVSDASVSMGQTELMLNHIMKEKYIHNFLNPETFVDYRRYNFSDKVFKGLKIRSEEDSNSDYQGKWFVRATYPSSELNRNRSVVEKNQKLPTDPVWWNK